jgi:hypothetical protein
MSNLNSMDNIGRISSNVNDTFNMFFGSFNIISGQFVHLDNYLVNITKTNFKFIKEDYKLKIHSYGIDSAKLKYHYSELLPSITMTINNLNKFNIENQDATSELLENVLYFRPPTIIHITYHPTSDMFSVKNLNMATIFLMKKIKTT